MIEIAIYVLKYLEPQMNIRKYLLHYDSKLFSKGKKSTVDSL